MQIRERSRGKTTEEIERYIASTFRGTITGTDSSQRFVHNWTIQTEADEVILCPSQWAFLQGFSENILKTASSRVKGGDEGSEPYLSACPVYDDNSYHDFSHAKCLSMAAANGLQIDDRMIQCGLTRNNATHINALIWFQEHFACCGEPPPNGKGLHLEVMDKKDIYDMCQTDCSYRSVNPLLPYKRCGIQPFQISRCASTSK